MRSKSESHEEDGREKYTVWILVKHADAFRILIRKNSFRESDYVGKLIGRGMPVREARLRGMRRRARWWPPVTTIVANAISRRLEEEDLQGPWDPLTDEEEELMMLSGRWPGHNVGDLRQRNYELPSSLLKQLRTASWRVSQGPLADLEEEGLTYHSMDMPPEDVERRNELIEKVYAPPRIVREALDRYGPQPTEEEDQGAE